MSMFGGSLADRLKAAVNQLEATGTSLQARALSPNASPQPNGNGFANPQSPSNINTLSPITSPSLDKEKSTISISTQMSPTKNTSTSTAPVSLGSPQAGYVHPSQLAENALSGLRKSFHFGRGSGEFSRSTSISSPTNGQQELRDIVSPSSPSLSFSAAAGPSSSSRPTSPNPKSLSTPIATTLPKSPLQKSTNSLKSALLPNPDPSDPATYPLPPSPDLTPSASLIPPSATSALSYADPLGASPLLEPNGGDDVPKLGLQEPTPDIEKNGALGLGVQEAEAENAAEPSGLDVENVVLENGDTLESSAENLTDAQRRYDELSNRFTALLTQTHNTNKVLRDLTPLEGGVADHEALEGWIRMMNGKVGMITEEMNRLQNKLTLQHSRMEELRDTHRLEGSSQLEFITKLRSELSEAQTKANNASTDQAIVSQLRADLTKVQTQAKEEEEKRTKAISLLKTVRMKLVKAEKDKEEVEKDRAEERAERSRAGEEVERVKAEREREVNSLRKGFERELAGVKERYEKDLQTKKAAWELEMITTKATHAKELSSKTTKVNGLEAIVKELSASKTKQFEVLQAKQAEAESARAESEAMQTRTKELEFQLREANERCAILEDSVRDQSQSQARSGLSVGMVDGASSSSSMGMSRSTSTTTSAAEVQRLLSEAESRAEAKLSDLRFKIRSLEAERNESEEEWSSKLQERVRELEKLRRLVQEKELEYSDSLRVSKEKDGQVEEVLERVRGLEREMVLLKTKVEESKSDVAVAVEAERAAKDESSSLQIQITTLQTQLDEAKSHSTHLKQLNKTLREEMRKIQSSVQLMERSRNPGVGYWSQSQSQSQSQPSTSTSRSNVGSPIPQPGVETPGGGGGGGGEPRRSLESTAESNKTQGTNTTGIPPGSGTGTGTGARGSPAPSDRDNKEEEEVNLEYLRNVILQFLEHKEMRPNLIRVLSVILRFTPQELRRLNAKISA